jgi:hypothetical protein
MSISYNPGVTDRSGELLGAGIRQAGASIADAIDSIKQQHDKLKATKAMVDAWGGDSSKMNQQQAQAFLLQKTVVEPARAEQEKNRSEQESNKQLGSYLQSAAGAEGAALPNTGPVKDDLMATLMQGRGPQANMVQSPSPDALKVQLLNAVKSNPAAFINPRGQELLSGYLQQAAARQTGSGVTKDPNSGLFMGRNGQPLNAPLQNLLLGNAGGKAAAADSGRLTGTQPPDIAAPEGFTWARGATGWEQQRKPAPTNEPRYTDPDKPPTSKPPEGTMWKYNGKFWEQASKPPKYAGKYTDPDTPPDKKNWPEGMQPVWDDEHGHWKYQAVPMAAELQNFMPGQPGGAPGNTIQSGKYKVTW